MSRRNLAQQWNSRFERDVPIDLGSTGLINDAYIATVVLDGQARNDRLRLMTRGLPADALMLCDRERKCVLAEAWRGESHVVGVVAGVLASLCARLYGRRGARNRAIKSVGCAQRDVGPAAFVGGVGQDVS
jgi:putative resolvase